MTGTSYQNAPTCIECGNTPLLVKWVAKRMADGFGSVASDIVRCPYRSGWHVLLAHGDNPELLLPLPAYKRPQ